MDILIKNMEMPKYRTLLEIYPDGIVSEISPINNARISTEATAIPVPEHGDLIDRDKEINEWEQTRCIMSECGQKHTFEYRKACVVITALSQAEVVLERTT